MPYLEIGSSPLARVELDIESLEYSFFGIIPACAGRTTDEGQIIDLDEDHPRLRG